MVPQQVIGPRSWLTFRVHIGSSEEIGLDIHLLYRKLTGSYLVMNPLVRRVETTIFISTLEQLIVPPSKQRS